MKGEATLERPWIGSWPEGVPKSIDYPEIPVHELLRRAGREFGDRPAITFYGKSTSYRDLDAAADRFAAGLRRIGVLPGDLVSLVLPNAPHFIVAFFAVLRAGGIVVQTNPLYTPRELESLWTDAGVETVVTLDLFWHKVSKARANAGVKRVVVCDVGEFLKVPLRQLYPIKKRRDLKKQGHWPLDIPPEARIHRFSDPNPGEIGAVLKLYKKTKPSLFPGVPTMYIAILRHPKLAKYDLRSIRACISGAAPLPNEVRKQFEAATGGRLVEGYGLTEASPVTHCNPLNGVVKECIGIPFPDTDAKVVDPDDPSRELAQGDVGELAVRGPEGREDRDGGGSHRVLQRAAGAVQSAEGGRVRDGPSDVARREGPATAVAGARTREGIDRAMTLTRNGSMCPRLRRTDPDHRLLHGSVTAPWETVCRRG